LFIGRDDLPNFVHGIDDERIRWHGGILPDVYQNKFEQPKAIL
jgi:hypothetical protein